MPLSKIESASLETAITAVDLAYTGTLTGGTGVVNLGSGQVYKDASGNLLVGDSTGGARNTNSVNFNPAPGYGFNSHWNHINGTSSGIPYLTFNYNGGTCGSIAQSGTTAVAYNTTSDYRLKENVAPLTGALARVAALKPVTYTWKAAPDETGEGFIAHELAEVCPQATTGEKDAVDADGNPQYQGIDTSFLVATLTAAIQEQQTTIVSLQDTLTALTAQTSALAERLTALEAK